MKIRKEFKIGIFTIVVMAMVYWGINFLKGIDVLSANNHYYAYYEKSDNVEVSSPILVKGIKIGTVTAVGIESVDSEVRVTLTVNKKYKIPADSKAQITSKSLLGGKAIILEIGESKDILESGETIEGTIDNNMSEQIDEVKATMEKVIVKLNTTLDGVNTILSKDNTDNLAKTFENLSSISTNLDKSIENDLGDITKNLSQLSESLNSSAPSLERALTNIDSISTSIKDANLGEVIASAGSTISALDSTLAVMNDGSGTVGKLLNDPALYNSLNGTSSSLDSLFQDLKENPKRYVHFSLFGRKEK